MTHSNSRPKADLALRRTGQDLHSAGCFCCPWTLTNAVTLWARLGNIRLPTRVKRHTHAALEMKNNLYSSDQARYVRAHRFTTGSHKNMALTVAAGRRVMPHWPSHGLAECSVRPRALCNILEKIPHTRAGDVHVPIPSPRADERVSTDIATYLPINTTSIYPKSLTLSHKNPVIP